MTSLARPRAFALAFTVLCGLGATPSLALTEAETAAWIDGALALASKAGAIEARRGAVRYDPASGALDVTDIAVTFPKVSIGIARLTGSGVTERDGGLAAERLAVLDFKLASRDPKIAASLDLPEIAATGVSAPLLALDRLDREPAPTLAAALQGLRFAELTIPDIDAAFESEDTSLQMAYRDSRLTGLSNGRVQVISVGEGTFRLVSPGEDLDGRVGNARVEDIDFGVYADLFGHQPMEPGETRTLYARTEIGPSSIRIGQDAELTIGPISAGRVSVKVPRLGLMGLIALIPEKGGGGVPDPVMAAIADWFDVINVESLRMDGAGLTWPGGSAKVERLEVENYGVLRYGALRVIGGRADVGPAGRARVGLFELADFDMGPFYLAVLEQIGRGGTMSDPAAFAGRLPRIGRIELADIEAAPAGMPPTTLGRLVFSLGAWRGFMPERIALAVDRLVIASSHFAAQQPVIAALGYDQFDISTDIAIAFDEGRQQLTLLPGRIAIKDGAAIDAELALGGIAPDTPLALMGVPAQPPAVTFQRFGLRFDNAGLLERLLRVAATAQRSTPPALVQAYAGLARQFAQGLPDQQLAADLEAAITAFSASLKSFTVSVVAPEAVPIAELQAVSPVTLANLLARLQITVRGE